MPRPAPDLYVRVSPTPLSKLPYASHPIYNLRKLTLVVDILGLFFAFVSAQSYYYESPIGFAFLFLAISVVFVGCDVLSYARKKEQNPDEDPEWPLMLYVAGDIALAFVMFMIYWIAVIFDSDFAYRSGYIPNVYAALTTLITSILHLCAFWKQLMARYKKKWLALQPQEPCVRCGYPRAGTSEADKQYQAPAAPLPANIFPYAGPSANFARASAPTPESVASSMEEGLLIGSEFGSGYGSIASPEPAIYQPEEIVVAKGKKKNNKKRAVSKEADDSWERGVSKLQGKQRVPRTDDGVASSSK